MTKVIWITLIFGSCFILGVKANHCTAANEQQCWEKSNNYVKSEFPSSPSLDDIKIFHLTETQLRKYCQIFEEHTSGCLADIRPHCTFTEKLLFQGQEDAFDYLCKEKLDVAIRYSSCLGSDEVGRKEEACSAQFDRDLDNINIFGSVDQVKSAVCNAVYDFIDCAGNGASSCGKEAVTFMTEYRQRIMDPYMEQFDCSRSSSSAVGIAVGVVIAIIVLITIAVVIGVCCIKNKKTPGHSLSAGQQSPMVFSNVIANARSAENMTYGQTVQEKNGLPPPSYVTAAPNHYFPGGGEVAPVMYPPPYTTAPPSAYEVPDPPSNPHSNPPRNEDINQTEYESLQPQSPPRGITPPLESTPSVGNPPVPPREDAEPVYIDPAAR